jgi:beta-lactamase regulating signal transducer with metallopeptidase domain
MDLGVILHLISSLSSGAAPGLGAQGCAESAASIVIGGLWQGAVVACGLALCLRLAPAVPARLRYGVWAAGFAALVWLPFLPSLIGLMKPVAFNASATATNQVAAGPTLHSLFAVDARWSVVLAGVWLAASLTRASSLGAHAIRMRSLWRSASPVSVGQGGALGQRVDGLIAAPVEICTTSDLDRPCVIGFLRPRILIPAWLLERLTAAELEHVVLHEQEHLRRGDDWANLLQKLCLVVFPLNPALWWLERRLCAEREMACDDGVVGRTQAPRAYAACLAGLAEKGLKRREAALSLGAWRRRPELAERVHRLLRRGPVLSPAASAASVALVGCGLVAGTIGLARCPQLVAFVAPANHAQDSLSASATGGQSMEGDVRTDFIEGSGAVTSSSAGPYHAVKTMAVVPSVRRASLRGSGTANAVVVAAGAAGEARRPDDAGQGGHSLASLVPKAIAARMKGEQMSASSAQQASAGRTSSIDASEDRTSWIVLTTFEEVQTTGPGDQVQGDAVVGETSAKRTPGAKSSASLSVTQLVLRIEQPISNDQPASKADPSSNSAQPVVIPYRDGWFVIQL